MSFTNRGDALLSVLRTRLLTVTTLPTARAWANQRFEPTPGQAFVEDELLTLDTARREVGVSAYGRSTALYRVIIHTPAGTGAMSALAIGVAVTDAFARVGTSYLTRDGFTITVVSTRSGPVVPATQSSQWYSLPVYVSLQFDHP